MLLLMPDNPYANPVKLIDRLLFPMLARAWREGCQTGIYAERNS